MGRGVKHFHLKLPFLFIIVYRVSYVLQLLTVIILVERVFRVYYPDTPVLDKVTQAVKVAGRTLMCAYKLMDRDTGL